MIKIYSDSKIYVHCPAGIVTGGAELLHQLVSHLNDIGRDAYIVYFGKKEHSIPSDYKCYNIKTANKVIDDKKNIEVIYEGVFYFAKYNSLTQKFLWWLSVDHFYTCSTSFLSLSDIFKFNLILGAKALIKRAYLSFFNFNQLVQNCISVKTLSNIDAVNGYQSEYAQHYLQEHGFKEIIALKDYINTEHYNHTINLTVRENIILYNPKKGQQFTKKLIKAAPDLNWQPIQGMSRSQLIQVMNKAKVYVDFGYHPGKDRLPRECAANGCCIITGMRGSAAYFEDVMIPHKYKFNERKTSIKTIINTIRWIISNYEVAKEDFQLYRKAIVLEKQEFEKQISLIFT